MIDDVEDLDINIEPVAAKTVAGFGDMNLIEAFLFWQAVDYVSRDEQLIHIQRKFTKRADFVPERVFYDGLMSPCSMWRV